jgi:glycosyltransferase involved in cell wall biosynthesis
MSRFSIAVAMCTCNGSRYVREQLQSIARQTTAADELVVCDDGSTDQTTPMVEEFAAGSPISVRLVRNPIALGCTRNFEQAIRLCSSQIIVLADQDDRWKPNKLAAIARAFADQPGAGYVFSDAEIVDESGSGLEFSLWETVGFKAPQFLPSRQVAMLLKRNLVTGAAMAFRASLRGILLPIPPAWNHDYWLALLGSVFSYGVPIPERLFLYRRHLGQQMGCGKDTLLQRVRTSIASAPDYHAKGARMAELRERVAAWARTANCPLDHLRLVAEKELHLSRRALIRSARGGARIAPLIREAASGRYQRFSFSWGSMIRDLTATAASPH